MPSPTTKKISAAVAKRAKQIKVFLMDVDGTITDGSVTLLSQPDGSALEIKTFDAHDGQGLTLAHTAGLRTGCITGRESAALLRRANEMKMEFIYMRQPLKLPAYEEILRTVNRVTQVRRANMLHTSRKPDCFLFAITPTLLTKGQASQSTQTEPATT